MYLIMAVAETEIGKARNEIRKLDSGLKYFGKTKGLFSKYKNQVPNKKELMPLRDKIQEADRLARKIRNLMDLATTEERNKDALAKLKKHQSALGKLIIIQKIPKPK